MPGIPRRFSGITSVVLDEDGRVPRPVIVQVHVAVRLAVVSMFFSVRQPAHTAAMSVMTDKLIPMP